MAGEKLRVAAKIDVRHVPFKDNGLTEVMAGRIGLLFHSARRGGFGAWQWQARSACGQFGKARSVVARRAVHRGSRLSQR